MDPSRFDTLVRTLTTGGSRRRLLGVLSTLPLVGSALAAAPEDTTAAKDNGKTRGTRTHQDPEQDQQRSGTEAQSCVRRCRKKSSKQARRKCRKRCTPPTPECTTNADCPVGELCESGVCIPIPDQCTVDTDCDQCERCAGGVCGPRCQGAETCCRATGGVETCCPAGDTCQNGTCVTPQCQVDADCGDCSRCQDGRCRWQCTVTEVCLSGAGGRCCQPRSCPAGADCGTVDDGCGGQVRCGADTCTQPSNPCQDAVCTSNICTPVNVPDGQACGLPGEVCQGGACVCPSGVICPESGCCAQASEVCNAAKQCCTQTTCAAQGKNCGTISDGCGGMLDCGSCAVAGEICGGRGLPNVCGNGQGTCPAGADVCAQSGGSCNGGGLCYCMTSVANTTVCASFALALQCGTCSPSRPACPNGWACVRITGRSCPDCTPGQYRCQPLC